MSGYYQAEVKHDMPQFAKALALPVILFLGFMLLAYNTVEGSVCLLAGILNVA